MLHSVRRLSPRTLRVAVFALLVGTAAGVAPAQTKSAARGFVWSVERDGRTSWLVGSLHVLTKDAYPLPGSMARLVQSGKLTQEDIAEAEAALKKIKKGRSR